LWIATISSFGGSIGILAFDIPLPIKILGFLAGITLSAVFFNGYVKNCDRIENIIKVLKKRRD